MIKITWIISRLAKEVKSGKIKKDVKDNKEVNE